MMSIQIFKKGTLAQFILVNDIFILFDQFPILFGNLQQMKIVINTTK